MTKKDYIVAAKLVREFLIYKTGYDFPWDERQLDAAKDALLSTFTEFFKQNNPAFDAGRFVEACEICQVKTKKKV